MTEEGSAFPNDNFNDAGDSRIQSAYNVPMRVQSAACTNLYDYDKAGKIYFFKFSIIVYI